MSLSAEDTERLRLAAAYADLLRDQGEVERAEQWVAAIAAADEDDVAGTGRGPQVVFSEEEIDVEPAVTEPELDFDDDVEAEVAELLGEDHPQAHPDAAHPDPAHPDPAHPEVEPRSTDG